MGGWDARSARNDWTLEQHLDKAALLNGPRLCCGPVHFVPKGALRGLGVGRRGGGDGRSGFQYRASSSASSPSAALRPSGRLHDELGRRRAATRRRGGGLDALRTI